MAMTPITISSGNQASAVGVPAIPPGLAAAEAAGARREAQPEPLDRVTLRNAVKPVAGRDAETARGSGSDKPSRSMGDILFSYNFKGDLRIKFMDSVNKLVYQTPPVYFSRMADLMMSPQTSVNTKA